jgi:beta-glucosidase
MWPRRELKGFAKISLAPGEKQKISVTLDARAFAFYDPQQSGWVTEKGRYQILVGSSSRDLVLHRNYQQDETVLAKDEPSSAD